MKFNDHNDRWTSTVFIMDLFDECFATSIGETSAMLLQKDIAIG